ncbi:MAG: hypothetical protein C4532_02920 [Candidatus Abyssobacteria bacterium SURF_17]|uniref:Fibronectin type-III domain-containing protein n=1 Tax=Candidatus Abyssobacteria bacterium SURF_17 TaxID=2093361 RepID=A0A419F7A3_9BACT|nr:MAG: hypothetical protein C4532_02920 [Candidatus Abyssubacteria bacterium SURF_17]
MKKWTRNGALITIISTVALLAFASEALAAATIDKNISKNAVWKATRSPYIVSENIVVEEGVTLTIQEGVRVELAPEKSIEVRGKLMAIGSEEKPIVMTAHSAKPWGNLYFTDFSADASFSEDGTFLDGCILNNCIIEKGHGIYVRFGSPLIADCVVRDNVSSGIRIEFGGGRIVRNRIHDNSTAQDPASGNGGGIIAYTDKSVLIADNHIYNNTSEGGRDGGGGVYAYASEGGIIVVRENMIYGNTSSRLGGGIYAYSALLFRNKIMGNSAAKRGGGIYAVESNIQENVIQSNTAEQGGGMFVENSDALSNSIVRNTAQRPEGGGIYYFGSGDVRRNCIASNSAHGTAACGGIYVSGNPEIHQNNIFNNAGYALYVANVADAPDLLATDNFWGTLSEKAILDLIFDWLDNETYGLSLFMPYLQQMEPAAPQSPPQNLLAVATNEGVQLSWDQPGSTAADGHIIYFGTENGGPHGNTMKAGPEKTCMVKGLKPGVQYSFAVSGLRTVGGEERETAHSERVRVLCTGSDESIMPPASLSPRNGDVDVSRRTPLKTVEPEPGARVVATRWQISMSRNDFSTPTLDITTSGEELYALARLPQRLQPTQKYYWRAARRTAKGSWSPWSQPASFITVADNPANLSGPLPAETRLEKRLSPYKIIGNTLVLPKGTLWVEPGVELRIAPGTDLMVQGKLVARGTSAEPIIITRQSAEEWGRLIFADSSEDASVDIMGNYTEGSVLEYCTVEYGNGILVEASSPLIKNCTVAHHADSGIIVRQGGPFIMGNDIHHNAAPTNGGGIYAYTNDIIYIVGNRVHHNHADGEGGGVYAYGYMNTSAIRVEDNTVFLNEATGNGGGIYLSRSSAVSNSVESNRSAGNGGGIYATFGLVEANEVRGNEAAEGGGIYAERNCSLTRNYVAANSAHSGFGGGVYVNFWGMSIENEIFTRNTVTENRAPSEQDNGGVFVVGYLLFEENNIFGNMGSQLYNGNEAEAPPLTTVNCYWGSADENAIAQEILDGDDNPMLSKVTYTPFSPEPLRFD